jgi:hypothetical protein
MTVDYERLSQSRHLCEHDREGRGPSSGATVQDPDYEREYVSWLVRRSYRDGGKVRHETLANLSALPEAAIEAVRAGLARRTGCTATSTGWAFPPDGSSAVDHTSSGNFAVIAGNRRWALQRTHGSSV